MRVRIVREIEVNGMFVSGVYHFMVEVPRSVVYPHRDNIEQYKANCHLATGE